MEFFLNGKGNLELVEIELLIRREITVNGYPARDQRIGTDLLSAVAQFIGQFTAR